MKNLFARFNKVGLFAFVLGLLLIGTQSAFKAAAKLDPPADGWYEVTITDPMDAENPEEQAITGTSPLTGDDIPPLEDEEGCAQTQNSGFKCAVYLDFESTATTIPATVDDVDNVQVSINGTSRQPL